MVHLEFEKKVIPRGIKLFSAFPEVSGKAYYVNNDKKLPNTIDKMCDIFFAICRLANSEENDGGIIFLGVNKTLSCLGYPSNTLYGVDSKIWLNSIQELEKSFEKHVFVISKLTNELSPNQIKIRFINYLTKDNSENNAFLTAIAVEKSENQCVVAFGEKLFSYSLKNGSIVDLPIDEIIVKRFNAKFDIGKLFNEEEGEMIEFKETSQAVKVSGGYGKYISSFANTFGGTLYIGIKDDRIISGIQICSDKVWDTNKLTIFNSVVQKINNSEYLSKVIISRIALKTLNYYVIKIEIPKNTYPEPIKVLEKEQWVKYIRIGSLTTKDSNDAVPKKEDTEGLILCQPLTSDSVIVDINELRKRTNDIIPNEPDTDESKYSKIKVIWDRRCMIINVISLLLFINLIVMIKYYKKNEIKNN